MCAQLGPDSSLARSRAVSREYATSYATSYPTAQQLAKMTATGVAFMAQKLLAVSLCVSWCEAQGTHTVTACMDEQHRAVLSQFEEGSREYDMLRLKYQTDIADSLGVDYRLVDVRGAHSILAFSQRPCVWVLTRLLSTLHPQCHQTACRKGPHPRLLQSLGPTFLHPRLLRHRHHRQVKGNCSLPSLLSMLQRYADKVATNRRS